MDTILITGGAGFIGSCLVRVALAQDRFRVVNLDKLTYAGNLDSLDGILNDPRHVFVQGDIGDHRLVLDLLTQHQPRAIINLAAETHVDRSIDAPDAFLETNVRGTMRLLQAACAYHAKLEEPLSARFRFLHVSTDEVYGSLGSTGRFTEGSSLAPNSPYAASKAASDHFVRAFSHTFGLPAITTHCSNNYGPYQFPEKLIPLMILNAVQGKPLPLYADGKNVRDWLYVEDHCRALLAALERGRVGEVYNLGGDCERANVEIVNALCEIIDDLRPATGRAPSKSLITFVADRPGHDLRYAIDSTKAHRELGWKPTQDLTTGLRKTVEWYLGNSRWIERVTSGSYRGERLGLPATK